MNDPWIQGSWDETDLTQGEIMAGNKSYAWLSESWNSQKGPPLVFGRHPVLASFPWGHLLIRGNDFKSSPIHCSYIVPLVCEEHLGIMSQIGQLWFWLILIHLTLRHFSPAGSIWTVVILTHHQFSILNFNQTQSDVCHSDSFCLQTLLFPSSDSCFPINQLWNNIWADVYQQPYGVRFLFSCSQTQIFMCNLTPRPPAWTVLGPTRLTGQHDLPLFWHPQSQ